MRGFSSITRNPVDTREKVIQQSVHPPGLHHRSIGLHLRTLPERVRQKPAEGEYSAVDPACNGIIIPTLC